MTEPNGSILQKPDPDEPRTGLGTTLQTRSPGLSNRRNPWSDDHRGRGGGEDRGGCAGGPWDPRAGRRVHSHHGRHARPGPGRAREPGTRGAKAEVGGKQTAIDLQVVVEYGVGIREVAAEVRQNVIAAVERMTGLEVAEVNIAVKDVHLPAEAPPQISEDRVLQSLAASRGKAPAPSLLRGTGRATSCRL